MLIISSIYIYLSVIVHEIGHLVMAKILGAKQTTVNFSLSKFNVRFNFGRKMNSEEDFSVTIAGVIFQFILGLVCFFQPLSRELTYLVALYIPSITINILPYNNLDGFHLVKLGKTDTIRSLLAKLLLLLFSITTLISIIYVTSSIYKYFRLTSPEEITLIIITFIYWIKLFLKIQKHMRGDFPWRKKQNILSEK